MKTALRGATFYLITVIAFCTGVQGVAGQGAIQIEHNEAVVEYPRLVRFLLQARSSAVIDSVTLIYSTNALSCQGARAQQAVPFEAGEQISLEWEWKLERAGALPPGTVITWQWQISDADGNTLLTEARAITVQDQRHTWQTLQTADGKARIQWYEGDQRFGARVARITQNSLQRLSSEIGIAIDRQVQVIVYPTFEEVNEVMIVAHDWVGGVAFPEYGSVLFGARADDTAWLEHVIPHELAHLLVSELTFNCRGVRLPTWLSEGLSVVSEGNLSPEQHDLIRDALEQGKLRPFNLLEREFSLDPAKVSLEYAQSGALVEFMLTEYGADKLAALLEALKNGLVIDLALMQVYGLDTDGLDSAWRVSLGYQPLPTPAPTSARKATTVPTLALYTSVVQAPATPTPPPATPTRSPQLATATQAATSTPPGSATSTPLATPENSRPAFPACGGVVFVVIPLITGLAFHRRRQ